MSKRMFVKFVKNNVIIAKGKNIIVPSAIARVIYLKICVSNFVRLVIMKIHFLEHVYSAIRHAIIVIWQKMS